MTLCCVPPEDIDHIWPHLEPLLEEATATSHGRETAFDVRRELMARDAQLFIWWAGQVDLLAVVHIVRHPRKTVGGIRICTGRPHAVAPADVMACVRAIEEWCRGQGATGMKMDARGGWERMLKPLGYERTHVVLEKDL